MTYWPAGITVDSLVDLEADDHTEAFQSMLLNYKLSVLFNVLGDAFVRCILLNGNRHAYWVTDTCQPQDQASEGSG